MKNIHHSRRNGRQTVVNEANEETFCFLVRQIEAESLFDISEYTFAVSGGIVGEILNSSVAHQMEQIQHESGALSQSIEGLTGQRAELSILTALDSAHAVHHLYTKKGNIYFEIRNITRQTKDIEQKKPCIDSYLSSQSKSRRQWLWISPENVTKINVKQ